MKKAWQEEGVLPDPWIPEATYVLLLAVDTHLFSDLIHGPNSKTLDPIKEGEWVIQTTRWERESSIPIGVMRSSSAGPLAPALMQGILLQNWIN